MAVRDQYKDIITEKRSLEYQLFWDVYKCKINNEIDELERILESGDVMGFVNSGTENSIIEEIDNIMEYDPETVNRALVESDSSHLNDTLKKYPHRITNLVQNYDKVRHLSADELLDGSERVLDEVFNEIREINTFPKMEVDLSDEMKDLHALFNSSSVYNKQKKRFEFGNAGLQTLDRFFPNLNDVKKDGLKHTIRTAFYDDYHMKTTLRKALKYNLKNSRVFYRYLRISGVGYCTNFKPVVAKSIYEEFGGKAHGVKVYDFAAGYAGRFLGAYAANNVAEYVGVDVNTETVKYHQELKEYLQENYPNMKKMKTLLCGSEDFIRNKHSEYVNYFDIAFSSPQYFNTEIYSDEETQSCHAYPKYGTWLSKFYIPTILNALDSLNIDGTFGMNIFEKLPVLKDICKMIASLKGFYLHSDTLMALRTMPGAVGKGKKRDLNVLSNGEPIWFFKHYDSMYRNGEISKETRDKLEDRTKAMRNKNMSILEKHYSNNEEHKHMILFEED